MPSTYTVSLTQTIQTAQTAQTAQIRNKAMNKQVLIITHAQCVDGLASAAVATLAVRNKHGEDVHISYWPMSYKDEEYECLKKHLLDNPSLYTEVFCVDMSLPVEVLKAVALCALTKLRIYDHHKTAEKLYAKESFDSYIYYGGFITIALDKDECGATLTFRELRERLLLNKYEDAHITNILEYVKDYDLWTFNHGDDTRALNLHFNTTLDKLAWSKVQTAPHPTYHYIVSDFIELLTCTSDPIRYFLKRGYDLLEVFNAELEELAELAKVCTYNGIKGRQFVYVQLPADSYKYVSRLGNLLCERYGKMAIIAIPEDNGYKLGFRSNEEIGVDVSLIAESFGGGGHKYAAGATGVQASSFEPTIVPLEDIYE